MIWFQNSGPLPFWKSTRNRNEFLECFFLRNMSLYIPNESYTKFNWTHRTTGRFCCYKNTSITLKRVGWADGASPKHNTAPERYTKTQHNVHSVLLLLPESRGSTASLEIYISEMCKWNLSSECLNNSRLWPHDPVSCKADLTDVKKKGDVWKCVTSDREII
jgi:hypothetical protein